MFKRKTILMLLAIGIPVICFTVYFIGRGETNSVKLTNSTDVSVCLFAYEEQILKSRAGQVSVTDFKVRGDGDFYITDCEGNKTIKDLGYYTRSLSGGCHIITVIDKGATLDWVNDRKTCYQD